MKFSKKNTIIENYKKKDIIENNFSLIGNKSLNKIKLLNFINGYQIQSLLNEIKKINLRIKGIFDKNQVISKLKTIEAKMLEANF